MEDLKEITKEQVLGVIKANNPDVAAEWIWQRIKEHYKELGVIHMMLQGTVEKEKVSEYIEEYLLKQS